MRDFGERGQFRLDAGEGFGGQQIGAVDEFVGLEEGGAGFGGKAAAFEANLVGTEENQTGRFISTVSGLSYEAATS